MGISFGGGSKSAPSTVQVWKPQERSLVRGLNEANDIYSQQKGTPAYGGDTYAGMDMGILGQVMNGARDFSQKAQGWGNNLAQQGMDLFGLSGGQNLASLLFDMNNKDGAMEAGSRAASSPYATDMISAVNNDVARGVAENDLPQARLSAIGSGNSGSSRLGAREAIITRGAEDRMAANAANIRGSFFDKGTSEYNNNISTRSNELASLFNRGLSAVGAASDTQGQSTAQLQNALGLDQANRQGFLDQDYNKWNLADMRPWEMLQRMWGITGQNIGQMANGGSKSSPSYGFRLI